MHIDGNSSIINGTGYSLITKFHAQSAGERDQEMSVRKHIQGFVTIFMAAGLSAPMMHAADRSPALGYGSVHGVAIDQEGRPLPTAFVTIHSIDGGMDRKVVSDGDGVFAADDLMPGPYRISAFKDGFASPPAATVAVAQNQTVHPTVVFAAAKPASSPSASAIEEELAAMKERIAALEAELSARKTVEAAPAPAPAAAPAPTAAATPAPAIAARNSSVFARASSGSSE